MRKIKIVIGMLLCKVASASNYLKKEYYKSLMNVCGKNVYLGNGGIATYENISIGNHVYIGSNYVLQSAHGKIIIGNHVMFGPGVHIHGGNHIYNRVGEYMDTITKQDASDGEVVIEDDVWIGSNAIVLSGVHIGYGSIVGAGAVVTKDVAEGSIVAGNPAHVIGMRFNQEELDVHKKILAGEQKERMV